MNPIESPIVEQIGQGLLKTLKRSGLEADPSGGWITEKPIHGKISDREGVVLEIDRAIDEDDSLEIDNIRKWGDAAFAETKRELNAVIEQYFSTRNKKPEGPVLGRCLQRLQNKVKELPHSDETKRALTCLEEMSTEQEVALLVSLTGGSDTTPVSLAMKRAIQLQCQIDETCSGHERAKGAATPPKEQKKGKGRKG